MLNTTVETSQEPWGIILIALKHLQYQLSVLQHQMYASDLSKSRNGLGTTELELYTNKGMGSRKIEHELVKGQPAYDIQVLHE